MGVKTPLSLILNLALFLSPLAAQPGRRIELVVQTSHTTPIYSLSFSPDGRLLVSAGGGTIILWEVKSGRQVQTFRGGAPVLFGPDGKTLAGLDEEDKKKIKLWNLLSGNEIRTLEGHASEVKSLAFNYDGTVLASGGEDTTFKDKGKISSGMSSDATIKLWNVRDGKVTHTLRGHHSDIDYLAFTPDGKVLASAGGGVIDAEPTGKPESEKAESTPYDTAIKLWDVEKGAETQRLSGHVRPIYALIIKPDGQTLVSVSYDAIKVWDIASGVEKRSFSWRTPRGLANALSADGNLLASSGLEGEIEWINVPTGEVIHRVTSAPARIKMSNANIGKVDKSTPGTVMKLAFSPDGKKLASADMAASIIIWDAETGRSFLAAHKRVFGVTSVRFSPDGKTLASVSGVKSVNLWNVGDITESRPLRTFEAPIGTFSVVFSPDSRMLASADWFTPEIKLWDAKTGSNLKTLKTRFKKDGEVPPLAFSVDGKRLVTESKDREVEIWDVESGNLLNSFNAAEPGMKARRPELFKGGFDDRAVTMDASDRLVAVAPTDEGSFPTKIVLFNLKTERELCTLNAIDEEDWVVTIPEGRFDTSKDLTDINVLHWRVAEDPLTPLPLEILMRGYYEPNLLRRVLRCNELDSCDREFKRLPSIADINRVQPKVTIREVRPAANVARSVDVTVEVENTTEEVSVLTPGGAAKTRLSSGAFDLRLFRDRQLVGVSTSKESLAAYVGAAPRLLAETKASGSLLDTPEDKAWREAHDVFRLKAENVEIISPTTARYTFRDIKLPQNGRREVAFTAYAFNSDRVKSATTEPVKFVIPSIAINAPKKGRAVLLSIGVNASENPAFNLRYAVNDARKMQEIIGARMRAESDKYAEVIQIPLLSDYDAEGKLIENSAQKAVIRGVFSLLAGNDREVPADVLDRIPNRERIKAVEPEDTLIIAYSGHGYADQSGIFYLLPYDIGAETTKLSTEALQKMISSDELSLWMQDISAAEMIMIVDACHSSAAVQGDGFKPGPMGSRGLGQLAYDKDIKILSATQANNIALELTSLEQGLLSYALLEDGIKKALADVDQDRQLFAAEWLLFAESRVPELYQEIKEGKRNVVIDGRNVKGDGKRDAFLDETQKNSLNLQQPHLFDFKQRSLKNPLLNLP